MHFGICLVINPEAGRQVDFLQAILERFNTENIIDSLTRKGLICEMQI